MWEVGGEQFVKEQGAVAAVDEEYRRTPGSKREVYGSLERTESEGQA